MALDSMSWKLSILMLAVWHGGCKVGSEPIGDNKMTIKREIQILEQGRHVDPDSFEVRLGLALRCRLGGHKKILNHFNYHLNDMDYLIKLSYRR